MIKKMKVGIYVNTKYAKQNYKNESYNIRLFWGLEMIRDVLKHHKEFSVGYCTKDTVKDFDVVLVSITANCDWYPFIAEQREWVCRPRVIVGGAGVLNVRGVLPFADQFVLGRAEDMIVDLLLGNIGENVIDSKSFSMDKKYTIKQASQLYPNEIKNKKENYKEGNIGCQRKCLFCAYTWQRKLFCKQTDFVVNSKKEYEATIFSLLKKDNTEFETKIKKTRNIGLDGTSERLRRKVNKPITRKMWQEFLTRLSLLPGRQMKIFNIVGYPTETVSDREEFLEDIKIVDSKLTKTEKQWSLAVLFTPFRAMPATPAATWEMAVKDYRKNPPFEYLKERHHKGNIFYTGNKFWCVQIPGEGLAQVLTEALIMRATESDAEIIEKIAISKKFWNASARKKRETLLNYLDVNKYMGSYTWKTLPSRYLESYCNYKINLKGVNNGEKQK